MAAKVSKGSIILEILIVLMALLLVAVILVPNKIWKEEEQITRQCRDNMNALYEAERFYFKTNETYTDTLSKLLTFIQSDSGLKQRQTIVSLTRSYIQVINNILSIPAIEQISNISLAAFEITGDLVGNRRYFRKYEDLDTIRVNINREMMQFDSSANFPNFCRTKLFIDSLRNLREKISDYPLQSGILYAINYTDSISTYFNYIEWEKVKQFWNAEYAKIDDFVKTIRKTDIAKISSVPDRLKKFIDRIQTGFDKLETIDVSDNKKLIETERQNLEELHQRFLSPEYFILTQRYGLTSLNETDSILINLNQEDFYCPDNNQLYLIGIGEDKHLTVECPNLLDEFHQKFKADVDPIRDLPLYNQISELDSVFARTKKVLNHNRTLLRRYTDILLNLKELLVEMDNLSDVFFYKYAKELKDFVTLVQTEKKLSVLKPAIEDILNPMDTLAVRMEKGNISDLEQKMDYFKTKLEKLDSLIQVAKIPARIKRKVKPNAEAFASVYDVLSQMKITFSPSYAQALHQASKSLEADLLNALEGKKEVKYVIFYKRHINHGFIQDGEKSWEKK